MTNNSSEQTPGQKVGQYIRAKREEVGVGLRELSEISGVPRGTLSKLETGVIDKPGADLLTRVAKALGTSLSDLQAAAGYDQGLPSLPVYLRSQYKHLSPSQRAELTKQVMAITEKFTDPNHGTHTGPYPGEDETD